MWYELQRKKYLVLKDFLDPDYASFLGQEFESWCKTNDVPNDSQVEKSSAFYRWAKFSELQYDRIGYLNKLLGIYLFPTYNYARSYHHGATMAPHKDRPGCEISITCHLSGDEKWPIFFAPEDEEPIALELSSGEAILYLGCDIEHWRDEYNGERYNQVFLHYVDSRGEWGYCENDIIKPN